jgi:hypothetical protein
VLAIHVVLKLEGTKNGHGGEVFRSRSHHVSGFVLTLQYSSCLS